MSISRDDDRIDGPEGVKKGSRNVSTRRCGGGCEGRRRRNGGRPAPPSRHDRPLYLALRSAVLRARPRSPSRHRAVAIQPRCTRSATPIPPECENPRISMSQVRLNCPGGPNSMRTANGMAGGRATMSWEMGCGGVSHAGQVQNSDHGRLLRVAPGLEDPVRRTLRPPGLPSGRGRPHQCRGLPGAPAGQGPQGPRRDRFAQAPRQGDGRRRRRGQPQGLRPRRPRHAGAAVPLAGRPRAARCSSRPPACPACRS